MNSSNSGSGSSYRSSYKSSYKPGYISGATSSDELNRADEIEPIFLEGTVMVVDDNPTNLGVLVNLLRETGLKVLVATDGEAAIEQIQYVHPDLILLDVMMPGIDGFEVCGLLKSKVGTQDIPIIFMTALSETIDKIKGFNMGAVDYITKPFEQEEVLVRIKTHLTIQNLRKTLQAQNQSLQQEIIDRKRAEEALKIFLHAVSHDLRNPVTGMTMVLNNLLDTEKSEVSLPRSTLVRMSQSSERQLGLINSLLESHVNDVQGLILHRKPWSLLEILDGAIHDLKPLLQKEEAIVMNQVSLDLPLVDVDGNQVCRVFQNLISNAIKHNPPNLQLAIYAQAILNETTKVASEDSTESEPSVFTPYIHCVVEDRGVGMSPEQCDHLFELYVQGKQSRRSLGLGLGLYLCRQIITAHGGEIGVESTLGSGSKFWFTLPIAL
ncbi:hybrid sensor histidine kinase/response regulator [Tumidithrix elongata RA019]|uniref:histidine kinase n=1 Tax=Tumidithrix elongata BACA0141 TaxID=2716417 RepID=A0AAW9Q6V0_9CYAN|nr:hybrid sensor histidine kinase/response regulator [Tumidithrix elongata RA019]